MGRFRPAADEGVLKVAWAIPAPPSWRVDWQRLLAQFPVMECLNELSHSARFHTEKDVLTHTRLTCEMLAVSKQWRALSAYHRAIVFLAGLLHDIGKRDDCAASRSPASRHHGRHGARLVRVILYRQGAPFKLREAVVNLIRYHQVPFWILERENPAALVQRISLNIRCDWLVTLAAADAKGRKSDEKRALLEGVALFEEMAFLLDCIQSPAEFGSPHGRHLYFRNQWHVPDFAPPEAFRSRAVFLSGLPGAGKRRLIEARYPDLPVVTAGGDSLETIETALSTHLRARESVVVCAPNLSRSARRQLTTPAVEHGAKVEMVYKERPYKRLGRKRANAAFQTLMESDWEVPDPWEADTLRYDVDG